MYACSVEIFDKQSATQGYHAVASLANGASVSIVNGKIEMFDQVMTDLDGGGTT